MYDDSSSGTPAVFQTVFHLLDAIFEPHAGDHLRQVVEPPDSTPTFLGTHTELEHHGEQRQPATAPLSLIGAMSEGGEAGFDRVGCADMRPVLGRKIIEGEEDIGSGLEISVSHAKRMT